jgi:hypothetical protein
MNEPRERPQYGEYASVDEQIAAGGFAVEPDPAAPASRAAADRLPPPAADTRVAGAPPAGRPWDLALTTALLVFGAYSVVSSIPELLDYSAGMAQVFETAGVGAYTSTGLADAVGVALLVAHIVIYAVALVLTVLRLRTRKISFFVPLAGAALYALVTLVLTGVALFSDPAYSAWLDSLS